MSLSFRGPVARAFAPPRYLSAPLAGIDLSASGVKAVRLAEGRHGLVLDGYADVALAQEVFTNGEVLDRASVVKAIKEAARRARISAASVALPEAKSYIFETAVVGEHKQQWRTSVEQRLEEFVPLPPAMTAFDLVGVGSTTAHQELVVGVGFARRVTDDILAVFDESGIGVQALEAENFAVARALLPLEDTSTVLIVDVGKTTTKISIVSHGVPRFATTIAIGGHALTLAVQKYFGVTEDEAKRVKAERGIVPALGNEEYLGAMLSTVAAIRDEIMNRLMYWQAKATPGGAHEPVTRAILVGGNATVRGLQEYLESSLRIPVVTGDVFTNFAGRDDWLPPIEYNESLAYATAIGLALYNLQAP